jgi:hypothetical protein
MGSLSDCGLIATDIVEDAVGCDEIANALQRTTGHGERNARNKRRCCDAVMVRIGRLLTLFTYWLRFAVW